MPNKFQIVSGLFGAFVVCDLITAVRFRRKYAEVARELIYTAHENELLHTQMEYLVNLINEHKIVLDEFDLIVLTSIVAKED